MTSPCLAVQYKHMTTTRNYTVIFNPEPEGGFTAIVPSLPGCVSWGKDLTDAKRMIRDAMEGYIISLQKHGELVPTDESSFVSTIQLPFDPHPSVYA